MFECNVAGDRDPNYIKSESLMIELMAGGLSWKQQEYVIGQLEPNEWKEVRKLNCKLKGDLFMFAPLSYSKFMVFTGNLKYRACSC